MLYSNHICYFNNYRYNFYISNNILDI
ncbi:protein of unknown function [Ruminococcaceae bacterium BL-6]|nr:protein of unknown function [Ruminococcaceae bacterium BL-6]